ncbi:MAG TPA: hypothetical protein VFQ91_23010 [Bryobacteraceae bacterium]|nr:hypothetical protein [Bryobacteraceae bacterium]
MRFFPQLETHTAGQYPLTRERHERVVRYESLDGRMRTFYDGQAGRVRWALRYDGLTDGERAAIDALYQECEGRLQTFIFLDPAANLLRWSEDYTQGAWTVDPLMMQEQGWDDPWGMTRGTRIANTGIAPQRVAQTITASGQHQYCLSAYVGGMGQFRLRIDAGGFLAERTFTSQSAWNRYSVSFRPGSDAEQVTFSLYLEPGQSVKVSGMQADAQPAPGGYRRTNSRSGVYLNARFAEDELTWVQQAPNHNAAEILIESRPF